MVMKTNMKVAVIGLGNIGKVVAKNLIKGNRKVILASRKLEDAQTLAKELGSLASAAETGDAIKNSDIIILSVWFNTIKEILQTYASELEGKIIIDPSNPIAPDENGGFKKIIDADKSAGQINASFLPKNAKLAKALGTLGAASLSEQAFRSPERTVLFYATDDNSINNVVEELIADAGFVGLRIGCLDQSIRIEVFGNLHEFGALGKVVTLAEANKKL
jgi:8-hydroxy-5-deazaflavin:NADPH oxidoreductase